jgi:hypothetical protein
VSGSTGTSLTVPLIFSFAMSSSINQSKHIGLTSVCLQLPVQAH